MQKKKFLIILIIIYLFLQVINFFIGRDYNIQYNIDKWTIYETKNKNSYHFKIVKDDMNFDFQTKLNLGKKSISKIEYYKGSKYKCVLPVTKTQAFLNFACYDGTNYYTYDYIKGNDSKLDNYVKKYVKSDNNKAIYEDNYIEIYDNLKYKAFSVESYKGIYTSNGKITNEKIFTNDIYTKDISTYVNNKYLVADYNQKYQFHEFYLIDILNNKKEKIISDNSISIYSYIQGVVGDKVYLLDTLNKKQYEIDVNNKTVLLVGNENNNIKIYENNKWKNISIYKALDSKIHFTNYEKNDEYDRIDKIGDDKLGFYYLYKKVDNKYIVYRKSVQNKNNQIILFECDNINDIIYDFDTVIYKDNGYIKYYSNETGIKKVVKYDELRFNKSIKFNYIKE